MVRAERGHIIEARGYTPQRWLWRMRGDMAEPPPGPEWPAGYAVRTMEPADERRAYELIEEAFVRPDRSPVSYEEWRRFIVEREDFDRSLAFLAVQGSDIVGTAMCLMDAGGNEGWVRQLAVDARHRGLGLGKALLLHTFGEFYRRARGGRGWGSMRTIPRPPSCTWASGCTRSRNTCNTSGPRRSRRRPFERFEPGGGPVTGVRQASPQAATSSAVTSPNTVLISSST